MGDLSSALAPILQVGSAFYGDAVSRKQTKQQNELELQTAQASAANQREQNRIQLLQDETDRRAALKRAMAKQRAEFGGSGVGSDGGSSEAVLLGLYNESDEDRQLRDQLATLKDNAISLNEGEIQQKNLLEQAQQLEKQNLARLTDRF